MSYCSQPSFSGSRSFRSSCKRVIAFPIRLALWAVILTEIPLLALLMFLEDP